MEVTKCDTATATDLMRVDRSGCRRQRIAVLAYHVVLNYPTQTTK